MSSYKIRKPKRQFSITPKRLKRVAINTPENAHRRVAESIKNDAELETFLLKMSPAARPMTLELLKPYLKFKPSDTPTLVESEL